MDPCAEEEAASVAAVVDVVHREEAAASAVVVVAEVAAASVVAVVQEEVAASVAAPTLPSAAEEALSEAEEEHREAVDEVATRWATKKIWAHWDWRNGVRSRSWTAWARFYYAQHYYIDKVLTLMFFNASCIDMYSSMQS